MKALTSGKDKETLALVHGGPLNGTLVSVDPEATNYIFVVRLPPVTMYDSDDIPPLQTLQRRLCPVKKQRVKYGWITVDRVIWWEKGLIK